MRLEWHCWNIYQHINYFELVMNLHDIASFPRLSPEAYENHHLSPKHSVHFSRPENPKQSRSHPGVDCDREGFQTPKLWTVAMESHLLGFVVGCQDLNNITRSSLTNIFLSQVQLDKSFMGIFPPPTKTTPCLRFAAYSKKWKHVALFSRLDFLGRNAVEASNTKRWKSIKSQQKHGCWKCTNHINGKLCFSRTSFSWSQTTHDFFAANHVDLPTKNLIPIHCSWLVERYPSMASY